MKNILTVLAVCGVALLVQADLTGARAINGNGECTAMTVTDYIMSDAVDVTHSSQWRNITDGHLNFTMGVPGCAIVTFEGVGSVDATDSSYNTLHVRTLLDHGTVGGDRLCSPAMQDDTFAHYIIKAPSANSIVRICKGLTAGVHTIQVQYRQDTSTSSNDAIVSGHVLTVAHP